jgi:hypothetical protein
MNPMCRFRKKFIFQTEQQLRAHFDRWSTSNGT